MLNTFTTLVIIIGLAVQVVLYSVKIKFFLNPLFLFVFPLSIQYILYFFLIGDSHVLHSETNFAILSSIILFIIGFMTSNAIYSLGARNTLAIITYKQKILDTATIKKISDFLVKLLYIAIPLNIFFLIQQGISFTSLDNFVEIRSIGVYSETKNILVSICSALFTFGHIGVLLRIKNEKRISQDTLIKIIFLLISSLFSGARTTVIFYILTIIVCFYSTYDDRIIKRKNNSKSLVFLLGSLTTGFMYFLSLATNRLESDEYGSVFTSYLMYPIISFDKWCLDVPVKTYGIFMFDPIVRIFNAFGFAITAPIPEQHLPNDFTEFNVFTFMRDPYLDFGSTGLLIFVIISGVISHILFRKMREENVFSIFYSIWAYLLFISFYAYQYNLSSNLYYLFVFLAIDAYINNSSRRFNQ